MVTFVLVFLVAGLLAWGLGFIEMIPWRQAAGLHWTERARRMHRVRAARALHRFLVPGTVAIVIWTAQPDLNPVAVVIGALLGAFLGAFPLDREIEPDLTFPRWLHLTVTTTLLLMFRLGVFFAAVWFMPTDFRPLGFGIAAGTKLVFCALQFGLTVRLLRWMRLLVSPDDRLRRLVDETSARMQVPVRATWEFVVPQANAIAFIHTRELAFTTKLLAVAPDHEIRAVCAHELAHLTENRGVLFARACGVLLLLPAIFVRPAIAQFGGGGAAGLGVAFLLGWIGQLRLTKAMEHRADRVAMTDNEATYAAALERIHRVNLFPVVFRKRSGRSHPDLYDRMLAANVTPDYPRPKPPVGRSWTSAFLVAVCVFAMCIAFGRS